MNGWQCPKCGFCYAPAVAECSNCNRSEHMKYSTSNGTNFKLPVPKSSCCSCNGACSHTGEHCYCENHIKENGLQYLCS